MPRAACRWRSRSPASVLTTRPCCASPTPMSVRPHGATGVPSSKEPAMKILKNVRLIDGTGAAPVKDATIIVDGERIAAVTTQSQADFPADAEIIDCAGMTVLPGLIDCHDHMANHKYDLAHRWGIDEPDSTRHLRTAAVLRNTLAAGYTTIRDAGGLDAGFKRAIEEGLIAGPRLVLSISIISPIGGIGDPVSPSGFSCCVPHD